MKNTILLLVLIMFIGCFEQMRISNQFVKSLEFIESDGKFTQIEKKSVPKLLMDTLMSEKSLLNKKENKTIVFENTNSKNKYIFNYLDRDYYIFFCCDSLWRISEIRGSMGKIY